MTSVHSSLLTSRSSSFPLCLLAQISMVWATPQQTSFLQGFLPNLDQEKRGHGLNTYYARISDQFLEKWPVTPSDQERELAKDEQEALAFAVTRRTNVSLNPPSLLTGLSVFCC